VEAHLGQVLTAEGKKRKINSKDLNILCGKASTDPLIDHYDSEKDGCEPDRKRRRNSSFR